MSKNLKGGKRVKKGGEYVVPSMDQQKTDRKQYINGMTRDIIRNSEYMRSLHYKLILSERIIEFQKSEIESGIITMHWEGIICPKDIMESRLNININDHHNMLMEYSRLKSGIIEYLTEEELLNFLNHKFDIIKWQEDYIKSKTEELVKEINDEMKDSSDENVN